MVCMGLLKNRKFKTIKIGHIVFVDKGISKLKEFFKYVWHTNKKNYSILPYYEFRIDFFKIIFFSKELTLFEKIMLLFTCIKVNLSFVKIKYQNKLENEK